MNYYMNLIYVKNCIRYCAASARRRKAIRFAYSIVADGVKITKKVREDIYRTIMESLDDGVSCGIYSEYALVYFKGE